jgi:hypothetical protein
MIRLERTRRVLWTKANGGSGDELITREEWDEKGQQKQKAGRQSKRKLDH